MLLLTRRWLLVLVFGSALLVIALLIAPHAFVSARAATSHPSDRPSVSSVNPTDLATDVARDTFVAADLNLPNLGGGVDPTTLTADTVMLHHSSDNAVIAATLNTSAGGDVIVLQPLGLLDANTAYTFNVTDGLHDLSGESFLPFTSTFTTGTHLTTPGPIAFSRTSLAITEGQLYSSLTVGPDDKLYAATLDGKLLRFTLASDGTIAISQTISSLIAHEGGPRAIIGLAFDPSATADNLILWVSNNDPRFGDYGHQTGADDWSGKITRLSGPDLQTVQDYVINLPRSYKDHMTNSIAFKPGDVGVLYFTQGSNTAMGAPDVTWAMRPEHSLNAAVLRLDYAAIANPPLDVKTEAGGSYDPFAANAPLTIYASGVRNAYDLLWHSNGSLYVPTNGSAAGGNTPSTPPTLPPACAHRVDFDTNGAYTGPAVTGINNVNVAEDDWLFRILPNRYYGHPDPARCEWVMNGGNPSSGLDLDEVPQYPIGTMPDRNWQPGYDLGTHYSPDGVIEYHGAAFGGALDGKLLLARYSGGDDIIALSVDPTDPANFTPLAPITGFTGLSNPLDLVEQPTTGNIYVIEQSPPGVLHIDLLRPLVNAHLSLQNMDGVPYSDRLVFNRIQTPNPTIPNIVHYTATERLNDSGSDPLTITNLAVSGAWIISPSIALPAVITPNGHLDVQLQFVATCCDINNGTLTISSNDPATPTRTIELAGFWQSQSENGQEPDLSELMQVFGWATTILYPGQQLEHAGHVEAVGEEVLSPYWRRPDPSLPITVRQMAAYHGQGNVSTIFWHEEGITTTTYTLFAHQGAEGQSLLPHKQDQPDQFAYASFTPTSPTFGFKSDAEWSDPTLNDATPDHQHGCVDPCGHHVRFWPVKDRTGNVITDTWYMTMDYRGVNYDYNDNTYLITNITPKRPAPATPLNLIATGIPAAVRLDWQPNSEPDLAGYNVYRAPAPQGPFTKLNSSLLIGTTYTDTAAPAGALSYYQVTAVNIYNQASAPARASAQPLATPTPTSTPSPTCTNTATPIVTSTATASATSTRVPSATSTATPLLSTATATASPAAITDTPTPIATATSTSTLQPSPSATDTPLPLPTATPCAVPFVDIAGNVFYNAICQLYYRGVVNGTDATHYSPAATATRAQFARVVVRGFAIATYTPAAATFSDVPPSYFAYLDIESGYHAGILSGFDAATCANIGVPFPCYGPNRPITRAQLTKLVVAAAGLPSYTPSVPTFVDVPPSNIFYASVETAHHAAIINGYPDNTFRPNLSIRRDEMAQIVYAAIFRR